MVRHERQPYSGNEGSNPYEKQNELLGQLERSVDAIQDSESFRCYLDVQARFHQYSINNVLLILSQNSDATRVAGYAAWQKLGRQVRKGEQAIKIFVPMPFKTENVDGEEARRLRFGVGHVFNVSQTEGEPLPEVVVPILEGDEGGALYGHLTAVAHAEGVRVEAREHFNPVSAMGFYDPAEQLIVVREAAQR